MHVTRVPCLIVFKYKNSNERDWVVCQLDGIIIMLLNRSAVLLLKHWFVCVGGGAIVRRKSL